MAANVTRKLTNEIFDAINKQDKSLDIFLIVSKGGDGKTYLLRQIEALVMGVQGVIGAPLIDLYHSNLNSSVGISDAIAEAFAETGVFRHYAEAREMIEERRKSGLVGKDFETYQQECDRSFQECYDALSAQQRVVLLLDTAERMRYEEDSIQHFCDLSVEGTTVREWLVSQLARSHNTVCVIAGRPEIEAYLEPGLRTIADGCEHTSLRTVTLGGFNHSEVMEFYEQCVDTYEVLEDDALDSNVREQLWEATRGNPIRLSLALEVLDSGIELDPIIELIRQGKRQEISDSIDRMLVSCIFEREPDDDKRSTLRYLALTRRGLTAPMLNALEPALSLEECRQRLNAARDRSYVKVYAGERQDESEVHYFLHDEMYLLCDTYLDTGIDDLQATSRRIADYCEKAAAAAESRVIKQNYLVDSLIYRLRAAPQAGYEWFVQQNDQAIRGAEEQLDMRLHNEMLAFLRSQSPLDLQLLELNPDLPVRFQCDAGAGWVKRLMIRGRNKEAIHIYELLSSALDSPCSYAATENILAHADLLVYAAQAMIYAGEKDQAIPILQSILKRLGPLVAQLDEGSKRPWAWRVQLIAGRAHNNLGYAYWMNEGRFGEALEQFKQAIKYFRHVPALEEEFANVLDNMGRVYALVREQSSAETCVEEGLAIRKQLGRDYRVALSLNSRAIIHLEFDQPRRGLMRVEEALTIFHRVEAKRGVGLALITAGRIRRSLANLVDQLSAADCKKLLVDAERDLLEAERIFRNEVTEPVRLIDTQNELGAVYRDLAQIQRREQQGYHGLTSRALVKFRESIALADSLQLPHQAGDSYEDIAQTYVLRGEMDAALESLVSAEGYVPDEYKLVPVQSRSRKSGNVQHDLYFALLGKVEFLRGRIAYWQCCRQSGGGFEVELLRPVVTHYLLAELYLQSYYGRRDNDRLRSMERQIYLQFKNYSDQELKQVLAMLLGVADEYEISRTRARAFFESTIGLLLPAD